MKPVTFGMIDTKYVDCPDCGSLGEQMEAYLYPTGHTEVWVNCPLCDGNGKIEEADYLIMKLEGSL